MSGRLRPRLGSGIIAILVSMCALPVGAIAQTEISHPHPSIPPAREGDRLGAYETSVRVPDTHLRDSQDHEQQLATLLRGRTVVLDFVFTSCRTACPALSAILHVSEKQLGDRLGRDVILVSISVDPQHDTPGALLAYATKLGAGPHWYWLTGASADIDRTLRAFGVPLGGRPEDHPPMVLVGNADRGRWLRWVGLPTPQALAEAVDILSVK